MDRAASGDDGNPPRRDASPRLPLPGPLTHPVLPGAQPTPLAHFNNRFAGQSCCVVGRGITTFDYQRLRDFDAPVLFINDAVCLERFARRETFFFAHDAQLLPWLDESLRSTPVVPIDGRFFNASLPARLNFTGPIVYYHWREQSRRQTLAMTRDEVALSQTLFVHSGTIHSALHFAWYCGCAKILLIGCDGHSLPRPGAESSRALGGHDPRLENRSRSAPASQYLFIRRVQDELMNHLGLEREYLGSPR